MLIEAIKNSDDYMAKHFGAKGNLLYVDYCEPGLGISLIDENTPNPNHFLYRSTGFYNALGNYFFIRFVISEEDEAIMLPDLWSFQSTYKQEDIEELRFFLFNSIFVHPKENELLFKIIDETGEIVLNYKGSYLRKLCAQMGNILKDNSYTGERSFQTVYFSLKSAKLIKEHSDFAIFINHRHHKNQTIK